MKTRDELIEILNKEGNEAMPVIITEVLFDIRDQLQEINLKVTKPKWFEKL